MTTPSFASADPALLEEVIAQADARLQVQLTVAIAADQRAMTFAGLLFAGVAVLVGIASRETTGIAMTAELLFVGVGFLIAAALACWSARPVAWDLVGNFPSSWAEDVEKGLSLADTRAETAAHYEEMLQENEKAIRNAAGLMRASMLVAFVSATASLVSAIL